MANVVITSKTNVINVDFGDIQFLDKRDNIYVKKGTWAKSDIATVHLEANEDMVTVIERDDFSWKLSYDGFEGTFQVDSVDGTTVTSNSQLYTLISGLIE